MSDLLEELTVMLTIVW